MGCGDFTMRFEGQRTFKKITKSKYKTLLLLESQDHMSEEFMAWLDYSMRHGNGPSVPRIRTTVVEQAVLQASGYGPDSDDSEFGPYLSY